MSTTLHGSTPPAAVPVPPLEAWQLALKRTMDLVVASITLTVLAPFLAAIAIAIKLGSPGPVLFQQWRIGQAGRPFKIYKFRSMICGAESQVDRLRPVNIYPDARLFKVVDDPRITRFGRFLRRTSLDELPQLINVLRGDMSLVGPRPPTVSEVALYEAHHYGRFEVKPGITGPWQVSGRNRITRFEEVVALEAAYIRNWSLRADFKILLKTVPVVLRMHGAH